MNLKQGALLKNGEYRIEMVLGQGGFGITYLGVQTSLGRKVAIKEFFMKGVCERDANNSQVSISNADNKELVARYREKFLKEARSIASLEHRSIVPVIDVFECNGTAYYVMKHLGGGSLADKVKGGTLPEEVAVRYICQVAEALDFVHSQRMMHLDVKPANILLDDNGKAVLIDFGLAKQYDSEGQQTSTTPVGISHGYAPMEQYRRGGVSEFSPATDIYSLGATLYKLVIGSTPPEASDVNDDGLPALPDSISPAVRGAIEAAMQPRRKDRPQSIAEFLGKLKEQRAKSKAASFDNIGSNSSSTPGGEMSRSDGGEIELSKVKNENGKLKTASFDDDETRVGINPPRPSDTHPLEKLGEFLRTIINDNEETRVNSSSTPGGEVSRSDGGETELSKVKTENGKLKTASFDDDETRVGINPPRPSDTPPFEKVGEFSRTIIYGDEETRINSSSTPGGEVSRSDGGEAEQSKVKTEKKKSKLPLIIIILLLSVIIGVGGYLLFSGNKSSGNVGEHVGHEYVDLGLSVKWATCNVGASSPEDYGGYYAWGETEEKDNYAWSTYKWCKGSADTMTKYCTSVDNDTVLDRADDVAHVKWGGSWRMPTHAEQDELREKCTWTWITYKGVDGYKVTGPNGNSIFLPAAGYRHGTGVHSRGGYGYCWSSSLSSGSSDYASYLILNSGYHYWFYNSRYSGFSVRPVCDGTSTPVAKHAVSVSCGDGGDVAIIGSSSTSTTLETGATVTVTAMLNEGCTFIGWYVNDVLVSTDAEYTFTVNEDVALVARFKKEEINGRRYVDLGLPSGLKWATCNVGASAPEDYGGYYAWDETEEKSNYDWSTYKWCKGSYDTLTKYCTDADYGKVDNKTVLDRADDVAHVKWGGTWRMPTKAEQDELCDNCTWTWTTQNGVTGYKVTGSNGNSIFLPAAGCRYGTEVSYRDSCGYYWSSSLDSNNSHWACSLGFASGRRGWGNGGRCGGRSVRPVCD